MKMHRSSPKVRTAKFPRRDICRNETLGATDLKPVRFEPTSPLQGPRLNRSDSGLTKAAYDVPSESEELRNIIHVEGLGSRRRADEAGEDAFAGRRRGARPTRSERRPCGSRL